MRAVAVRRLLRADGEIQRLEREGGPAVDRLQDLQDTRIDGDTLHVRIVTPGILLAQFGAAGAPRGELFLRRRMTGSDLVGEALDFRVGEIENRKALLAQ